MMIGLNTIHFSPYEYGLDLFGLLGFAIGSFFVVSILVYYYNKISKNNLSKEVLETLIYLSKDELFQNTTFKENLILVEKSTSIWVKAFVFILMTIVVLTPLHELFGVQYFL